jgi:peroxiredoxin Q/BCP
MNKKFLAPFLAALVPAIAGATGIPAGEKAPDFALKNQNGQIIKLSEQRGKFVLMYFYPKDDTPGCTKEACNFRDEYSEIKKLNAVVFGISRQDEKSHQKFIAKHKLPFDLLVDADGAVAKAYGVGTMPVVGFHKRQSILVGPDGKVLRFYDDVDPAKHVSEVISDIKSANQGLK